MLYMYIEIKNTVKETIGSVCKDIYEYHILTIICIVATLININYTF